MLQCVHQHDKLSNPSTRAAHIRRLRLTNFRSHHIADIGVGAGCVIITGDNGSGKTNILEAISMVAPGRGLRQARFDDMITHGDEARGWTVVADIDSAMGDMRIGVGYDDAGGGRQLRIDGRRERGFESLAQHVPQLWLTPVMDRLLIDSAGLRRRFLDRFVQTLDVTMRRHYKDYEQAMRERNKLLTHHVLSASDKNWLDALEDNMACQGVIIAAARLNALEALTEGIIALPDNRFPSAQLAIDGEMEAALHQKTALEVEDDWRATLAMMRVTDAAAARTLKGVHRSDLRVYCRHNNMPASSCSTGEQKAMLVGLILAQAHSVKQRSGVVPLLLLDEVAAHLDEKRRSDLYDILTIMGGQSWITGTESATFEPFKDTSDYLSIDQGVIKKTSYV